MFAGTFNQLRSWLYIVVIQENRTRTAYMYFDGIFNLLCSFVDFLLAECD